MYCGFSGHLDVADDGSTILYNNQKRLGNFGLLQRKHEDVLIKIAKSGGGYDDLLIQAAVFDLPTHLGYVWINLADLWLKLHLKFSPHTGSSWYQLRHPKWSRDARKLELGVTACRSSVPYTRAGQPLAPEDDIRVLTYPSLSLPMLVHLAVSSAYSTNNNFGRLTDQDARDAFARLLRGMLAFVSDKTNFSHSS